MVQARVAGVDHGAGFQAKGVFKGIEYLGASGMADHIVEFMKGKTG